jgi:hypothetical protein
MLGRLGMAWEDPGDRRRSATAARAQLGRDHADARRVRRERTFGFMSQ